MNIRRNPRVLGLSLPGFPPLSPISQYTDDTSLVSTSDESIRAVFETFAQFEAASGVKLNRSKFKGLWLGAWSGRSNPPVALDWSSAKLKILGVFISHGNLEEDNWRPRIDAMDHVLTSWRSCSLTFRSKPSSLTLWLSPWSGTWLLSCTCLGGEGAFPFGLFLFLVW